jgi:hypothetical protein
MSWATEKEARMKERQAAIHKRMKAKRAILYQVTMLQMALAVGAFGDYWDATSGPCDGISHMGYVYGVSCWC